MKTKSYNGDGLVLYKYVTIDTLKKIISNKIFQWSSPLLFNDPFDSDGSIPPDKESMRRLLIDSIRITGSLDDVVLDEVDSELQKILDDDYDKEAENIYSSSLNIQELKEGLKNSAIFCLSAVNDSILMWSHYADHHKGAVIQLKANIQKDSVLRLATLVKYVCTKPRFNLSCNNLDTLSDYLDKALYYKAEEWRYEEEYRIVIPDELDDNNDTKLMPYFSDEIKAIYFGCRCIPGEINEVKNILVKRNLKA